MKAMLEDPIDVLYLTQMLGARYVIPKIAEGMLRQTFTEVMGDSEREEVTTSTILMFHTGSVLCIGCKSKAQARLAMELFISHASQVLGKPLSLRNVCVTNLVTSESIGVRVNVSKAGEQYSSDVTYNPRTFSGAHYYVPHTRMTVIFFSTGRFIITGVPNAQTLQEGYARAVGVIRAFAVDDSVPHYELVKSNKISPREQEELLADAAKRTRVADSVFDDILFAACDCAPAAAASLSFARAAELRAALASARKEGATSRRVAHSVP